ncbi:hypothetical protein [Yoonia sp.]|uniref:TadE/TadG family type IV pilus assembly protein n=1 Tax=Yoonia sp. TaxID=2212373 RepID=UPI0019FD488B|nr:hypothetical protein [Yoonia sp.]MBE0414498.1 hypothetical protein [Yoonia sp.]
MIKFLALLARFREEEDGVVAIELLLVVPMLVWALLSTFVYFDAYRAESVNTRAGLTLADMISRERVPVDSGYIDSMREVLRVLTRFDPNAAIRVSVFKYRASDDSYRLVWSEQRGMLKTLDDADLKNMRTALPLMADGKKSILVETSAKYTAPFSIGFGPFLQTNLDDVDFRSFTVISPRFLSTICFDDTALIDAICG